MKRNGNHEDPRYIRTETILRRTFREMIVEMPYTNISVKELMKRAGLNKKTFYLHYTDLDALLISVQQEVYSDTLYHISSYMIPEGLPELIDTLYRSWHEATDESIAILEAVYERNGTGFYDSMMKANWKFSESWGEASASHRKLFISFLASGLLHMYHDWRHLPNDISLDDLIAFAQRIFMNGIAR